MGPRVRAAQHFVSRGVEQLDGRLHAQTLCIRSASRAASGNIFGRSSASLPRSPMSGRIAQEQSDLGRRGCAIAEHSRSIAAELRLEARDASRGSEGRERIGIRAQRPTLATPKPHVILTTREDVTPPRSAPSGELSFMLARRTDGHGWGGGSQKGLHRPPPDRSMSRTHPCVAWPKEFDLVVFAPSPRLAAPTLELVAVRQDRDVPTGDALHPGNREHRCGRCHHEGHGDSVPFEGRYKPLSCRRQGSRSVARSAAARLPRPTSGSYLRS